MPQFEINNTTLISKGLVIRQLADEASVLDSSCVGMTKLRKSQTQLGYSSYLFKRNKVNDLLQVMLVGDVKFIVFIAVCI
jgi:hypothetical protein